MRCDLQVNTMVDLLAHQAVERQDATACVFLDDQGHEVAITYAQLDRRARAIAAELQQRASRGDRVLLVFPAGVEFISAFFGCLYAGVVAVPATYPKRRRPLPRMNRIAVDCGAHLVLTTTQTLETIDIQQVDPEVGHLDWIATDTIDSEMACHWNAPNVEETDLAFLQYTSGSTSDPKGVMVSHWNLLSNLSAIRQAFGIGDVESDHLSQTGVFWLPAYHDMGLIGGILTPLYVGGRSVLMSPTSFLQRPIRWLQAIDQYRATISGAPNFAYKLCVSRTTAEERASLDLSLWRLAFCGAEPIRAETITCFTETFAPFGFQPESLYPCYGLAESTLLATGPKFDKKPTIVKFNRQAIAVHRVELANGKPPEQVQQLVGCGPAVLDHELVVVDTETGIPVRESHIGEILLQGPSVAQGYWNRPELTREVFGRKVSGQDGYFLQTGDLGFVRNDELFVTGRAKDVIIIRGRNHYPQDIEQTVEAVHPAILPGAAFGVAVEGDERLVVVHQVDRQARGKDWKKVIAQIRSAIVTHHELDPYAIVLIRQISLPITSSGKVQRNLCREQYLNGQLKIVQQWTSRSKKNTGDSQGATPSLNEHANGRVQVNLNGKGITWSKNDVAKQHQSAKKTGVATPGEQPKQHDFAGVPLDRAAEFTETWLLEWLVERVGLDPADVDRNQPFAEFGVDSLTAVELSQELESQFGVPVTPVVAWNYPTPAALARYVAEQATGAGPPANQKADSSDKTDVLAAPGEKSSDDDTLTQLLAEVESLSDEEAARLLAKGES
jgi:acyl-CoA synthetase (AMP-forming)/AMP-acid ligase II/acyl carrier protein